MMVYRPRNRHAVNRVYRKKFLDYFLPLFLFIAFAVIVILGVQLYQAIFMKNEPIDAFLFTLQGRSQVMPVGAVQYEDALNQTRIFRGDEFHTQPGSRLGMRFFQHLWTRLDEKTVVHVDALTREKSNDTLGMTMSSGSMWLQAGNLPGDHLDFTLATSHLKIQSGGGVFEVEDASANKGSELVRVIHGNATVAVMVPSDVATDATTTTTTTREVETFKVSEGQTFSMDSAAYQAFQKYQSPEVVTPIDPAFSENEWYTWNTTQDAIKS